MASRCVEKKHKERVDQHSSVGVGVEPRWLCLEIGTPSFAFVLQSGLSRISRVNAAQAPYLLLGGSDTTANKIWFKHGTSRGRVPGEKERKADAA